MIRLQLKCVHGDYFDAWFGDRESFDVQAARQQVLCPHCGETDVAEAAPLKPGLYPDLTEDQARQMACDTRRMLESWIGHGVIEQTNDGLPGQLAEISSDAPSAGKPEAAEQDDAPAEKPRRPTRPSRHMAYDC